jgi:hypothetical protein
MSADQRRLVTQQVVDSASRVDEFDPTSHLSQDDRFSLAIGRLVPAHTDLEYTLRNVFGVLSENALLSELEGSASGTERLAVRA